ncbi:serine hydrolase [Aeoliella sp. SH292]|uniref:serine hydrolase n=1 Tax=Aeoliella sp. SH292 TaxID=3454464 RepID=UPI003F9B6952
MTALTTQAADVDPAYDEVFGKLDAVMAEELKAKGLPSLSICLVDEGRIVGSRAYGSADLANSKPANAETMYRIGSVSKLFTDLAIMQLVAAGKIDLDAPIQTYIPEFKPDNQFGIPITLRMLMSHQSGLVREPPVGNYFDANEPTLEETVLSLNGLKLVYKPGERTKYSNAAIAVVGYAIEKVSGQSYNDYMREHILEPMQMTNSSMVHEGKTKEQLAEALMWNHHQAPFPAPVFELGTAPAGNLYATVDDLGNFLVTIFSGGSYEGAEVLSSDTLATMLDGSKAAGEDDPMYGIGFRLGKIDGHSTFGHGGAVYGFSTQFFGLPEEKIGVAVATSRDCSNGFTTRLGDYATRLLLAKREGKPLPEWNSTKSIENPKQYVGTYKSGDESLDIFEFGGTLYTRFGFGRYVLRAEGDDLVIDDVQKYGTKFECDPKAGTLVIDGKAWIRQPDVCPPAAPEKWKGLVGEYGPDHIIMYVYEDGGQLWCQIEWLFPYPLVEVDENTFAFPTKGGMYESEFIVFKRDENGVATEANAGNVVLKRRPVGDVGDVFTVEPTRPVDELRDVALAAKPPVETRPTRPLDLVELTSLDPSIRLDVRYAGKRNFMQTPFYSSPHAFMQRPAAEAVARVQKNLADRGYGLLVHDGYRPWYVTKMFWDCTPAKFHDFVADPEKGSRHNRGCAIDLTLCDKESGEPIKMVASYDEFSPRSFPLYPGGDSRERWHRQLLRTAMEDEGFTVYEFEWWHFDFDDWQEYPIGNKTFEQLLEPAK